MVADHFWAAKLGRDALEVQWDFGSTTALNNETLREEFGRLAATRGTIAVQAGDAEAALSTAARTVEAQFTVPRTRSNTGADCCRRTRDIWRL